MLFIVRQHVARCCRSAAASAASARPLPLLSIKPAARHISNTAAAHKHNKAKEVAKVTFDLPESTPGHVPQSRSARTIKVHHIDGGDVISKHLNQRVQLFRLPRTVLEPFFYLDKPALFFTHSMFFLSFRALLPDVVRNINLGPNYLRGDYPQGVLHGRHEWRRPINFEENREARSKAAFRDVSEDATQDAERIKEHVTPTESMAKMRPLIVHGRDLDDTAQAGLLAQDDNVPFLVITAKKRVDKRASYRNSTKTRLIEAIAGTVGRHIEHLPRMDQRGNPLAMVWQVKEALKDYDRRQLFDAVDEALSAVSKMHQAKSYQFSAWQSDTAHFPRQRDGRIHELNAYKTRERMAAKAAQEADQDDKAGGKGKRSERDKGRLP